MALLKGKGLINLISVDYQHNQSEVVQHKSESGLVPIRLIFIERSTFIHRSESGTSWSYQVPRVVL